MLETMGWSGTDMHGEVKSGALILAAGEGSRLRSLTTTALGTSVPKQFCSLRGGPSLLQEALARAHTLAPFHSIRAVVAAQHEQWWRPQLSELPSRNITVQPLNRGTAHGVLLPLLQLLEADPAARIVLLPADHHVCEEAVLAGALRQALEDVEASPAEVVLLGIEPDEPDPQLGYIVPGEADAWGRRRVVQFVEKPPLQEAEALIRRDALWNAFIVAASGQALLGLFEGSVPGFVEAMRAALKQDLASNGAARAIARLYGQLPTLDFSGDVLAGQVAHLRVRPVVQCGWSDLGTPERVRRVLTGPAARAGAGGGLGSGYLNLAAEQERLQSRGPEQRQAVV